MYKTSADMGLTQTEIDKIVKDLWLNEKPRETCPDCGVLRHERHHMGCDVPQNQSQEIWSGWWPGIAECKDAKFICTYNNGESWIFDLNTYYSTKP